MINAFVFVNSIQKGFMLVNAIQKENIISLDSVCDVLALFQVAHDLYVYLCI